jgi:hypothetical protein
LLWIVNIFEERKKKIEPKFRVRTSFETHPCKILPFCPMLH